MTINAISIQDLSLGFANQPLFNNLNLTITAGKSIALMGASGIGKSVLLRTMAGLPTANITCSGHIQINGTSIQSEFHHHVSYLPQSALLLPWLTVLENTLLSIAIKGNKNDASDHAKILLDQVGLANCYHLYPHQLSGGMCQRVALARTLLENKPIILMDEPFSALDIVSRHQLQELTALLLKDKSLVFVTHDVTESLRIANHIYILHGNPATCSEVLSIESATPRQASENNFAKLSRLLNEYLLPQGVAA